MSNQYMKHDIYIYIYIHMYIYIYIYIYTFGNDGNETSEMISK